MNEDIHNDASRGMLVNEDVSQEQKEEMAAATRESAGRAGTPSDRATPLVIRDYAGTTNNDE